MAEIFLKDKNESFLFCTLLSLILKNVFLMFSRVRKNSLQTSLFDETKKRNSKDSQINCLLLVYYFKKKMAT